MDIQLEQITTNDTMTMTRMYHSAFAGLYEKYHDDATSPFKETPQSILTKINTATHHYYFININQKRVGLIGLIQTESAQITFTDTATVRGASICANNFKRLA